MKFETHVDGWGVTSIVWCTGLNIGVNTYSFNAHLKLKIKRKDRGPHKMELH